MIAVTDGARPMWRSIVVWVLLFAATTAFGAVRNAAEHFLVFSVDIEGDVEVTDFRGNALAQKDFALKEFRVRATPVFAFFDLDGNPVARYTGATRDAREFRWLGE